ncbi:hypothetical protein VTI74DRAFT_4431 [Chaetomium olivicolor]
MKSERNLLVRGGFVEGKEIVLSVAGCKLLLGVAGRDGQQQARVPSQDISNIINTSQHHPEFGLLVTFSINRMDPTITIYLISGLPIPSLSSDATRRKQYPNQWPIEARCCS